MNACADCRKSLAREQIVLAFQLLKIAFCEQCSMGERATQILAGQAERRMTDGW